MPPDVMQLGSLWVAAPGGLRKGSYWKPSITLTLRFVSFQAAEANNARGVDGLSALFPVSLLLACLVAAGVLHGPRCMALRTAPVYSRFSESPSLCLFL